MLLYIYMYKTNVEKNIVSVKIRINKNHLY